MDIKPIHLQAVGYFAVCLAFAMVLAVISFMDMYGRTVAESCICVDVCSTVGNIDSGRLTEIRRKQKTSEHPPNKRPSLTPRVMHEGKPSP